MATPVFRERSSETRGLISDKPSRWELNAVAASFVVFSALAFEALGLLPVSATRDVPAALRCTALVLVVLCGGPVVGAHRAEPKPEDRISVGDLAPELEQRAVLVMLVLLVAVFGERHGEEAIRGADALFVLAAGWAAVVLFVLNGERTAPGSALFGSGIFYAGVRIVSQAITHSAEVLDFTVTHEEIHSTGYALSDCIASTALAFGGASCACCGLAVLVNDRMVENQGTHVVSPAVSQIAALGFASALIAQLAMYSSIDALPALFSASSCSGDSCAAARRARRFFIANAHVGPLWACVVGMVVFSMPKERRGRPYKMSSTDGQAVRQDPNHNETSLAYVYFNQSRLPSAGAILASVVSATVVVAVLYFADQEGSFATAEVTLLYLSIPAVWFVSSVIGCALFVAGNAMYIDSRLGSVFGYDLRYFTHWSLAASTLVGSLLLATTAISWFGYVVSCGSRKVARQRIAPVEIATAGLTIILVSIQLALTLLTLSLFAAYDGALVSTETSFREQGYEYTLQHSISFFFSAALYGSRFEVALQNGNVDDNRERLSRKARSVCYYAAPPVLGVCWLVSLLVTTSDSPYDSGTSYHLYIGVAAAGVPWLVVGAGV